MRLTISRAPLKVPLEGILKGTRKGAVLTFKARGFI